MLSRSPLRDMTIRDHIFIALLGLSIAGLLVLELSTLYLWATR